MVKGETISEAYLNLLESYLNDWSFATSVHVEKPIKNGELTLNPSIDKVFREFEFPDGKTGEYWIKDREEVLFDENRTYYKRLRKNGKYDFALEALKAYKKRKYPTWTANRFTLNLFESVPGQDLRRHRSPIPPCLITIAFYPKILKRKRDRLSLVSTFRAQFVDTKAYGNMIASAKLLKTFCEDTGFEAGTLHNIANKPIRKHGKKCVKDLYDNLKNAMDRG